MNQLEPSQVMEAVNRWIEEREIYSVKDKKTLLLNEKNKQQATLQSLVCQFVYLYLLQQISPYFKKSKQNTDSL